MLEYLVCLNSCTLEYQVFCRTILLGGKTMSATQFIKKGQIIFREGAMSDFAFIIVNGKFEVSRKKLSGKTEVLDVLDKNDIFGEMGVIDGHPRLATVTALENGKVTLFGKEDLNNMFRKNPNALMPIIKTLSSRLRRYTKRGRTLTR